MVRAANQLAAKDALNFAEQVQTWYDYSRSRGSTISSMAPNGEVLRSQSVDNGKILVVEEEEVGNEVQDDEKPNLPSILKGDDGEEIPRFSRF